MRLEKIRMMLPGLLAALSLRQTNALAPNFPSDRRAFLIKSQGFAGATIAAPFLARAEEISPNNAIEDQRGNRPYAPLEALLPVTRLKLWLDRSYALSCNLSTAKDKDEKFTNLQEMDKILSNPPKLFYSEKIDKRAKGSTAQLTTGISAANKNQYQFNRQGLNVGDKFAAMLNQADVERQWGMLQYAESKREDSNEMRAAFNFYTRQITFSDKYILTAPKEQRKNMIRNDELPSLTAVITADLDLRDLYRNDFLNNIEDARAEVAYQVKQDDPDVVDTIDLVKQAYTACDKWFVLISPKDVQEAIDAVSMQSRSNE